jgi:zinc protease
MTEERPVTLAGQLACTLLALALALGSAPCLAATGTFEHKLGNGLRVIVKPDHRAPVAVSILWYKVGSMDEVTGATGVAHVLEHMMFKGTSTVASGDYSRIISAAGGRENAFTGTDFTGYMTLIQNSRLDLALRLEANRMVDLTLAPEEFAKEIRVVMEERRWSTEDRPRSLVYEQLMAAALNAHPYHNPIIGWMNDLQNMQVADVRAFYQKWYAPNNAILTVVGDVDPKEVFALAEKHFGAIAPRELPIRKPQEEPAQRGIRRVTVKAPAEMPYVLMTFRVPALIEPDKDWEPYALEMLAAVLDGNEAARLRRTLMREERLANNANASYGAVARGPNFFYLHATPAAGKTAAEVEQGLRREMAKIIDQGVSNEELDRAKAQAIAAQVYQRDSMLFQAREIGTLETTGLSHRMMDLWLMKLRQVTPEQVREVARKYFEDDALTIAYLDPQPTDGRRPAAPPAGLRHAQ